MTWWEREYNQERDESRGVIPRLPPLLSRTLLGVHVAAFVLMLLLWNSDGRFIVAAISLSDKSLSPWGILFHPFASVEFFPVLFTVITIWAFGTLLEERLGRGRFLAIYFAGNLVAGVAFYFFARFFPRLSAMPLDYPVGALAGWTLAAYRSYDSEQGSLLGMMMPVSRIILIFAGFTLILTLLVHQASAAGWLLAALVGALAALGVQSVPALEGAFFPIASSRARPRPARPGRRLPGPRTPLVSAVPDIDDILAKISRDGLSSLSPAERERLEAARQSRLHQSNPANR